MSCKNLFVCGLLALAALPAQAQENGEGTKLDNWYIGIGGGYHASFMHYSDLDDDLFPTKKPLHGGVFTIFAQGEFGNQGQYAVRPEIAITRRGGKLTEIASKAKKFYSENDINDIRYQLKGRYFDIRVPLIYQFLKKESAVRPYVYVAPVLGFCLGGDISIEEQYEAGKGDNYYYDGCHLEMSKKNMSSLYFGAAVGAGAKWQFSIGGHKFYLGAEAMYEYGFTDTYGEEKDGKATPIPMERPLPQGTRVKGSRKFQGFELRANLAIPLSVFAKKAEPAPAPVVPEPVYTPVVTPAPPTEVKEEKPCYSLDEINLMMSRGESVEGKTICAIDDAINFDFGKSEIKPESYGYLNSLAETLKRTNAKILVKGHTDNRGSEEFNLNLSKERAKAVMNYLIDRGVSSSKLSYSAFGMSQPLTDNDTEEGRRMNRRVEFEILK